MTHRLPIPGSDDGQWGDILNDFLTQSLNADGSVKASAVAAKANTADLAPVATSGTYADLTAKPTFAAVATSGSYADLTSKPTIPAGASNATSSSPGLVQLTGDLAGSATSPTVPGLAGKAQALIPVATVTNAGALVAGKHNPVDATGGALTMTLPTPAADGQPLSAEKYDATTNVVTLSGSIRGATSTITLSLTHETVEFVAASGSWWPVAGHKTLGSLDGRFGEKTYPNLRNLYNKIATINAGTAGRLKWLTFGDSYSQKILIQIAPILREIGGGSNGGYFAGSIGGVTTNTSSTSPAPVDNVADFDAWPSGLTTTFAPGASRTWGQGGSTTVCNQIKVYYVEESGAGTFKIQVDGVDASGFTSVSAAGTLGALGIATLSVAHAAHNVAVVGLSGSVRIIGVGFEDTSLSGLCMVNVSQGGIAMGGGTASATGQSTALGNFSAFLADVTPDVFTLECKESSSYYATALSTLFTTLQSAAPAMDIIGIGTTPISASSSYGQSDQLIQNQQLLSACQQFGCVFYDTYALFKASVSSTPAQDYAILVALGWQGDGTHVSTTADAYRGGLMLRDLGILNLIGRTPYERLSGTLGIRRVSDTADIGILRSDPQFGFDVQALVNRYLRIYDISAATESWRFATNGDGSSFYLNKWRIGSSTGPSLNADSQTAVSVRRGDTTSSSADLTARSMISTSQSQTATAGGLTMDLSLGSVIVVTLTGSVTSWAFSNAASSGQDIEVHFVQDATGGRTLGGANASIKLGTGFTLAAAAGKRDVVRFRQISGSYYQTTPVVTQA